MKVELGKDWWRLRWRILQRDPFCIPCSKAGRMAVLSEQVDHILARVNGGTNDDDNLQGICKRCHDAKTAIDLGNKPKGCDVNGLPTDPRHHWNRSS